MNNIPEFLIEKLNLQYGSEITKLIVDGYSSSRKTSFRINTLKATKDEVLKELEINNLLVKNVIWYDDAFIVENAWGKTLQELDIYKEGKIYVQNLSSMLPPLVVEPGVESILDMAAAPGGKTTEMAALSNNTSLITAVEKNKIRADRLKYNLNKQGASKVTVLITDARNLDEFFRFDKILLDAPCSGSGTILMSAPNTLNSFTSQLVKYSIQSQKELLKKASQIIKSGGEIIYSTCSILREENEDIVNEILKLPNFEIVPVDDNLFTDVPRLPVAIPGTICVCPNEEYEGFFLAKIKKIK